MFYRGGIEWFLYTFVFVFILTVVGFVYNAMDQFVINLSTRRASPEASQYLQTLDCHDTGLTSLEPLRACTGLQTLDCRQNRLTSLEPLRALTGLQTLDCGHNQLTSLEPLHGLKNLEILICGDKPSLSEQEVERFEKAVPSCYVEHWDAD